MEMDMGFHRIRAAPIFSQALGTPKVGQVKLVFLFGFFCVSLSLLFLSAHVRVSWDARTLRHNEPALFDNEPVLYDNEPALFDNEHVLFALRSMPRPPWDPAPRATKP